MCKHKRLLFLFLFEYIYIMRYGHPGRPYVTLDLISASSCTHLVIFKFLIFQDISAGLLWYLLLFSFQYIRVPGPVMVSPGSVKAFAVHEISAP